MIRNSVESATCLTVGDLRKIIEDLEDDTLLVYNSYRWYHVNKLTVETESQGSAIALVIESQLSESK
jgi:hypothetical protein